ncbi:phosphatase PAP2 family protein [Clostridium folliculivorans]|uniref:Phosphatase PAP2 family protein n=1 Tax=Clostridium folliculivorans TaxID=2886038 RepID=A0A9W5Y4R4_9CLOT|nr:phosphatase PAP2 family protein [Clostridium folliculivorans]GKU26542.1 phosphatase PAP2 family protein [Clostridium folliculivorans]GKU29026.1 phosphatase PAP2 family protein [Clostridium folliculivorans]
MYLSILKKINVFDNYILLSVKRYLQNKYFDRIMTLITSMGNLGAIWVIIALVLILDKDYIVVGDTVILTLIISTIVGEGLVKHLVRRIRPCNFYKNINMLIARPDSYSFPSGHTLSSFAVAEVLSTYFSEYKLLFIGIAFLIALSRIYLFVHYPTDVIAGIIIGTLCCKLVFVLLNEVDLADINGFIQSLI